MVRKNISSHHKSDQISTHYNKRALTAIAYNGEHHTIHDLFVLFCFSFFLTKSMQEEEEQQQQHDTPPSPSTIYLYLSIGNKTRDETRKKTKTWTKNGKTGSVNNSRSIYTYLCIYTTCMALFLSNATTTTSLSFSWSNLLR